MIPARKKSTGILIKSGGVYPREYPKKNRASIGLAGVSKGGAGAPLCVVVGEGSTGEGPHRKGPSPVRAFAYFSHEGKVGRGPGLKAPQGFGKKHVSFPPARRHANLSPSVPCAGTGASKKGVRGRSPRKQEEGEAAASPSQYLTSPLGSRSTGSGRSGAPGR